MGCEVCLHKVRCPVERRSGLIEESGIALEHVRDAWCDVERDRNIGCGCPCGEPERVAEQDLVRPCLDQKGRQSAEIAEHRADQWVRGVGPSYILRSPDAKALMGQDRVERLPLGQCLAGQGQIGIGRHQECT
jgi:hypothetical protein